MEAHVVSNLVVAVLVGGCALALLRLRRSRLWREAGSELVRRRPVAIDVIFPDPKRQLK